MPGPTYGKSKKTVKRMRQAKPRGSFRPDPAPMPKRRMSKSFSRGESRFERDLEYLSTLPQFDDPARAQRKAEKFIEKLIEKYGDKVDVSKIEASSEEPEKFGVAGLYKDQGEGEIFLATSPTFAWNMGAMNQRGIRLTPEQKRNLSPEGRRFVKYDVNSGESKRQAKESRLIAEKILAHEFAHAEQGETNALINPDWFVEGSAELRARKIFQNLYPNLKDPHKMYPKRVRRVKQYRNKYGPNASPYRRSDKILGVPLDGEMALNVIRRRYEPLTRPINAIWSVFD
jgi:hypothetical protein